MATYITSGLASTRLKWLYAVVFLFSTFQAQAQVETFQTVTERGNSTNIGLRIPSIDVGDSYDGHRYGYLQIVRPPEQGNQFHLSFIRSGQMVYGLGLLNNSSTFGLQPGGGNDTVEGLFMSPSGSVGIGNPNPVFKLDLNGGMRATGNLYVSMSNATGGGITLSDDGDIVDMNDGWATHRFSYGLHLTNGNASGSTTIQLSNGSHHPTFFGSNGFGVGTQTPQANFEVSGTALFGGANLDPAGAPGQLGYMANTGKLLIGLNRSAGKGETSFITNQGAGVIGGFGFHHFSNAGTDTQLMFMRGDGNIGIGTDNPTTRLDVRGTISVPEIAFRNADGGDDSDPYRLRKVQSSSNENWLELQLNDDANESFRIYGNSCQGGYGCGVYSGNLYHSFDASGNVYHAGMVGIGTNTPSEKLTVNGKIKALEIRVNGSGLGDYVFDNGYKNMPLKDLEKFIQDNKHLPEIPSAVEAEKNGLELGEMNKLLLKKIEELTLHLISEHKRNDDRDKVIQEQNQKIEALARKLTNRH
ncbi:tail fiber protein [Pedobacter frigidisoli]|uniref:tail fiber protein n=1 Tax=Pedobacter frigidisoli TaxID=2530455 RepID=UPI00292D3719|nr:tail fiber protein [Pedobacter frigidisoli]